MLPIAEHFHSIQGEGTFVGTTMHFIRTAGCNVGRANSASDGKVPLLPVVNSPAFTCRAWDGREFFCDTDFKQHQLLSVEMLLEDTWEQHVCLTGGEPLMHLEKLTNEKFFDAFASKGVRVHIETSGTKPITPYLHKMLENDSVWLTVAPKFECRDDMLFFADEIKLVVDDKFDEANIPPTVFAHPNVFLSPVNNVMTVRDDNLQRCLTILKAHPNWKLSCQWHKLIGAH